MLAMLSRDITEIGARMGFCFTLLGMDFVLMIILLPIIYYPRYIRDCSSNK